MAEYIEREAVMQKFADHVRRSNNSDFAPAPTWNQAVQIVEDSPAADVRPVVKARWGEYEDELFGETIKAYCCSNCHHLISRPTIVRNYCPRCGAKMEES